MKRVAWLLAIFVLVGTTSAHAHPHAFVVYSVVLPLAPQGVDRIGFVFTFDPMFSAIILHGVGEGDPETVLRNHARTLDQVPWEIEITFNGALVGLEPSTDLRVSTAGGRVTYRFVIPLQTRLLPPGTIDITVDDPGFFAAFVLHDTAVEVQAFGTFAATCERARTPSGAPGPLRCQYDETREPVAF